MNGSALGISDIILHGRGGDGGCRQGPLVELKIIFARGLTSTKCVILRTKTLDFLETSISGFKIGALKVLRGRRQAAPPGELGLAAGGLKIFDLKKNNQPNAKKRP